MTDAPSAQPDHAAPGLPVAAAWRQAAAFRPARPSPGLEPLTVAADRITRPLTRHWAEAAARDPHQVVLTDADVALRWPEVIAIARGLAGAIAGRAAGPGPVALLLPDGPVHAAAVFSGLIAGRPVLLLDTTSPPARNAAIIRAARAALVVTADPRDPAAELQAGTEVMAIGDGRGLPDPGPWADACRIAPEQPAFIVTTSGSTGRPKLVAHSHEALTYRGLMLAAAMGLRPGDVFVTIANPVGSYSGLIYIAACLLAGARFCIAQLRRTGVRTLFEVMRSQGATALRFPPSVIRTLAPLPGAAAAFARVRTVRFAGEQGTWADIDLLRGLVAPDCRITNSYGATETVSFHWRDTGDRSADPVRLPAGQPFPGAEAVIVTPDGAACPPGTVGELFVRSRFNALGEIEDGRLLPGRLQPDPRDPAQRIYGTGDLARLTADGLLVVQGRKDRMLNINGLRVEPIEIEAAIRRVPGVQDTIVLPRSIGAITTLAAFVATSGPDPAALEAVLRSALRVSLPAHMVPARIVVLPDLPRLPGGKIDGVALLAGLAG